jgi:hypothetical protein
MTKVELVIEPDGVVTVTLPLVAPLGTVAVIWESELTEKFALTPLNCTELAPVRCEPKMRTFAPTRADPGRSAKSVGGGVRLNVAEEVAVPAGVVTLTGPLVAPVGTVSVNCESDTTVNSAATPFTVTAVAPMKCAPETVTTAPAVPVVGERAEKDGRASTVKVPAVAVPVEVVTEIAPVVAEPGTWTEIELSELESTLAEAPLNLTDAELRCEPLIVTVAPLAPLVGENDETVGGAKTVRVALDVTVPEGVVTEIGPLVAPAGTTAVSCVSEPWVKVAAAPLNVTAVAPVRCAPVMSTVAPAVALCGEKLATLGGKTGGGGVTTVKLPAVVDVPVAFVTEIGPLVAPAGTFAVSTEPWPLKTAATPLNLTELT